MIGCLNSDVCPISKAPCPGVCLYAGIFETIDIGIIVLDRAQEAIEYFNPAAEQLISPGQDPRDFAALKALFFPAGLAPLPVGQQSTSFQERLLGYSVYPIPGGEYLWIFVRDITDKLRLESIADAVNTMENIGYAFSGIRHEIGNPLNSAKMTLSVLRENYRDFPPETALEFIDRSLTELLRVEDLLKTLRNINQYEQPIPERIALPEFLDRFVKLVQDESGRRHIRIDTEFSPDAQWALADPRPLQQVLLNLFTNAADALQEQTQPTILIRAYRAQGRPWIEVTDNGCGIPESQLSQLFKPFYTTKPNGTGLGLVICRKQLARMNCTISVQSQPRQGSSFAISLPDGTPECHLH